MNWPAIGHGLNTALLIAGDLANLLTVGPIVLLLVGMPGVILFYWIRGMIWPA